MKKIVFFGLIIFLVIGGCGNKDRESFQGTWQMVQMQRDDRGKVTNYFSEHYTVNQIKMWSGNYFIFVGKYEVDTTTSYRYGVGTYTIDGNLYEEDILYHFDEAYEGQKNKIWLEVRNDTLLHIFPVDDTGQPSQTTHWIEKYIRLK
jgi:hypothetical protein